MKKLKSYLYSLTHTNKYNIINIFQDKVSVHDWIWFHVISNLNSVLTRAQKYHDRAYSKPTIILLKFSLYVVACKSSVFSFIISFCYLYAEKSSHKHTEILYFK
jgi:hypothetical protein